jgi:hypothetical protein
MARIVPAPEGHRDLLGKERSVLSIFGSAGRPDRRVATAGGSCYWPQAQNVGGRGAEPSLFYTSSHRLRASSFRVPARTPQFAFNAFRASSMIGAAPRPHRYAPACPLLEAPKRKTPGRRPESLRRQRLMRSYKAKAGEMCRTTRGRAPTAPHARPPPEGRDGFARAPDPAGRPRRYPLQR